ncbi:MAG TPA: ABC transporter permease [Solirubrobacterales bacterium]|nr:ABC transporter permease [Solirubrobacterales bacterium]
MSPYLHFVILGLAAGSVYAVLASGLISVYRATGVLNFAQGAMTAWVAYVFAELRVAGVLVLPVGKIDLGGPMEVLPALAICAVVGLLLGMLAYVLAFRPLRRAPALAQVISSIGLMLAMQALVLLRFGTDVITPAQILPSGSTTVLGIGADVTALYLTAIAVAITLATWAYFRFTRLGVATRAGAQDERALRLMGHSPDRLAGIVWAATTALGGLTITLAAPSIGLNPVVYMYAVVPALAVALLGRLNSLGVACVAGLALGSFQSVVTLLTTKPWWPDWAVTGLQEAVPFLVIIFALFLFGDRMPARGSLGEVELPKVTLPKLRPLPVAATLAAAVVAILLTTGNYRFGIVTSIILVLLCLSYVLLTGYLGQISLAQLALAGTAGFALSKLTTEWHLPFPLSLLAAATVAMLFGVAVGLPAVRIRGSQLAVVTLALAVTAEAFVFNNPQLTPLSGNQIASPSFLGLDLSVRDATEVTRVGFCLMALLVVAVIGLLTAQLLRGVTGRVFLAVRSNERAAASVGIDVARTKLVGFALASFIAGVAGALIGYSRGQLSADSFTAIGGLSLLAIAYLGGIGSLSGAILAGIIGPLGIAYVLLTQSLGLGQYYNLVAGLSLIVTAIFNPIGMAGATRTMVDRAAGYLRRPSPGAPPAVGKMPLLDPSIGREESADGH